MRHLLFCACVFVLCVGTYCTPKGSSYDYPDAKELADVVVRTDTGDIYLQLYDETPRHKANFLKLVREGAYNGVTFHRIIDRFMVQSGDPNTKEGVDGGFEDYKLESEIVVGDKFLHTEGKLAAAREPDELNPWWESSGTQFYIVTGKTLKPEDLDNAETTYDYALEEQYYKKYTELRDAGEFNEDFNNYLAELEYQSFLYSPSQRQIYKEERGAPHLDFQYTVFGEVVSGMDVVKIIEKSGSYGKEFRIQQVEILQ